MDTGDQAGTVHRRRGGRGLPLEWDVDHRAVYVEGAGDDLHLLAHLDRRELRNLHFDRHHAAFTFVETTAGRCQEERKEPGPTLHSVSRAGLLAMSRSALSAWRIQRSASGPFGGRARKVRRCSAACSTSPRLIRRKATP